MKQILSVMVMGCIFCKVATAQDTIARLSSLAPVTTASSNTIKLTPDKSLNKLPGDDFLKGYIGVRFMPTFTSFRVVNSEDGTVNTKLTLGYGYGAVIGGDFSPHVGLQGEIIYSALSQRYVDKFSVTHQVNLDYVNVPLLLTLNTDVTQPVNFNVCFGPQVGFNTGSSITTVSGRSNPEVDTVSAAVAVKPADLGVAYGAGLDFLIGRVFTIDVGYRGVIGLINISDNTKSTVTNQFYILDRSHVNTYAAYAGIRFRF